MIKGFERWAAGKGITIERSPPYTKEQNSIIERSGGIIIMKAHAIHIASGLPEDLWPEHYTDGGYLLNRTPTERLEWKTPLEQLHLDLGIPNPQPTVVHLRTHGARAYLLIAPETIPRTQKLDPRAHIDYLVGYEFTNIFCIWILSKNEIIKTWDVRFNENIFYSLNKESDLTAILWENIDQIIKMIDVSHDHNCFFLTENLDLSSDFDDSNINLQEQADEQLH